VIGQSIHRLTLALVVASFAVAASAASESLGTIEARHLLNRTGFSASLAELDAYGALSRRTAVDRILAASAGSPSPLPVDVERGPRMMPLHATDGEKIAVRKMWTRQGMDLRGWWLTQFVRTATPLAERMTLFWHNHFSTSVAKVRSPALMLDQNMLFRRHAIGNFSELLHAVSKDPAMLIYLDGTANRVGRPNENFAREVMELFTLGEGRHTESDVREAARAFTGWTVRRDTGRFEWKPWLHDGGEKTVLGATGRLNGGDVLNILLAHRATADFIAVKLWREFVSTGPRNPAEQEQLASVANAFRESGYSIEVALRALLLTDAFWAAENRAALIKSPVELVVGALQHLGVEYDDPRPFALDLRALGQDLFRPPSVRGWPGGSAWITSTTLLARKRFLERLLRAEQEQFAAFEPEDAQSLQRVLLADAPAALHAGPATALQVVRHLLMDPVYQLR
jgi:uncharacterized protein (DUF1800 family)